MSADQFPPCPCHLPPQTKRGVERRLAFLESASQLFIEKGYDDVSLDDVVQHAGGSKATIYKYFGSKKGLFKAICDYRRDLFLQDLFQETSQFEYLELRTFLLQTLDNFYQHITQIDNRKFIRLLFEQVKYDPDLSEYIYQACPVKILAHVSQKLRYAHDNGLIFCENPDDAAKIYLGILWHIEWKIFMGVTLTENPSDIQNYILYSVDLFLKSLRNP
ncbi:TetR/AcrR family transcriptional regulator [Acinetobacter sp. MD2]|uniref:TetR/AcrR family transcriptional regulator n=1 Tax=Acinetobacter sp. MD2 TaxID=2600066 RepID=UPI002D1F1795|nr:TetR/AcrR family transcriptional regulator [Acinetobacter sp. MD2]MEB3766525.1 TetR/AcrR family transcriptional regulator [Acinetobacter sp. MD2]